MSPTDEIEPQPVTIIRATEYSNGAFAGTITTYDEEGRQASFQGSVSLAEFLAICQKLKAKELVS